MEGGGQLIGVAVFMLAWVAGVAAWFLAVAESIGIWRFSPRVFRSGFVVLSEERIIPHPGGRVPESHTIETANGKFRFLNPNECLFRGQSRWFAFRLHTPFPLKGSIVWSGDHAQITGRAPIFTTVFLGACLIGWTAISLTAIVSGGDGLIVGAPFLLFGIAVVGGMVALSLPLEKRRAAALVRELEAVISSPSV